MKGTLLELESIISKKESLLVSKLGVTERWSYVSGDMFSTSNELPSADAYIMKMILHDWSDENVYVYYLTYTRRLLNMQGYLLLSI
jgi:O-methyltransferase domain